MKHLYSLSRHVYSERSIRLVAHHHAGAAVLGLALLLAGPSHAASPKPAAAASVASPTSAAPACPAILNRTFRKLQDDTPQNLCQFAGKVVLVVNTASKCGFTPQYEGLEKLYTDRAAQGLVVLGFPTNEFGGQEPGDNKQIADFCFNTYGVKFPMFEKSNVTGANANALYVDLRKATGKAPGWNFYKYLINRQGKVVSSYPSDTTPEDPRLLADLNKALAER